MKPPPLIAGNWKKNGRLADLAQLDDLAALMACAPPVQVVVCVPATLLARAASPQRLGVQIGAQDCDWRPDGPHTGDLSAAMIADVGAEFVIVGHSERRRDHGEADSIVAAKAEAALAAGLKPIICVGESLADREQGRAEAVVLAQINASLPDAGEAGLVIAYEPVWAIGTGLTPTDDDIARMTAGIQGALAEKLGEGNGVRILYGGSVTPGNAGAIFQIPGVDGALVGGASLKSADFGAIIHSHPRFGGNHG
jgi:triosephosphate isomerase